jgi:hypothetical protein
VDRQFGLELSDAPPGGPQLVSLGRRQTGDESRVDLLLTAPDVDGLVADAEVASQIADPPSGGEEIEDASSKLGWIPTSSHGCLLSWTAA